MKVLDWSLVRIIIGETKFNIRSRYLGSRLGKIWLFLNPILMAVIYTFLMSYIFKIRIGESSTNLDYAVYLLVGMACFLAFSDSITLATSSIIANSSLVKNLVFPLEVLPLSAMLSSCVTLVISLGIALVVMCFSGNLPGWTLLLVPFWVILQYFFLSGLCLFLSAYNVFTRDIQQLLAPIITILMFASPVFYVETMVPDKFRFIWMFNPIYHLLHGYRSLIMYNRLPDPVSVGTLLVLGVVFLVAGKKIFSKTKPYFEERL